MTIKNPKNFSTSLSVSAGLSCSATNLKGVGGATAKVTRLEKINKYDTGSEVYYRTQIFFDTSSTQLNSSQFVIGQMITLIDIGSDGESEKEILDFTFNSVIVSAIDPIPTLNSSAPPAASDANLEITTVQDDKGYIKTKSFNLKVESDLQYIRKSIVSLTLGDLDIPWVAGETYTIEVGEGFVKGLDPNFDSLSQNLTFDSNPAPTFDSWTPVLKETTGNIQDAVINFTRDIKVISGTSGKYRLYNSSDSLIHTFNATASEVTYLDNTVTLAVDGIVSANTQYYIVYDANIVEDYDLLNAPALTSHTAIEFNTYSPPIYSWAPGQVTQTRNNHTVELTYRYSIAGNPSSSGTIRFYKSDGTLLKTFTPTGAGVSYVATSPSLPGYPYSKTVKFDVLGLLAEDSSYYMLIDADVFIDEDNFGNLEISDTAELAYSTDDTLFPGLKSNINASFTLSDIGKRFRSGRATLTSTASISLSAEKFKSGIASLTTSATISARVGRIRKGTSSVSSTFSLSSTLLRIRISAVPLTSTVSISASPVAYLLLTPTATITNPDYYPSGTNLYFGQDLAANSSYTLIGSASYPSGGYGGVVHMYQNSNNSLVRTFVNPDASSSPAYTAFGRTVAQSGTTVLTTSSRSGSNPDTRIYAYDMTNGSLRYSITTNTGWTLHPDQISTDGTYFSVVTDNDLYLYNLSNGSLISSSNTGGGSGRVHFTPGKLIHNYGSSGIYAWNLSQVVSHGFNPELSLAWSITTSETPIASNIYYVIVPRYVAGVQGNRYIDFYNASNGTLAKTLDTKPSGVSDYQVQNLSCDNNYLYVTVSGEQVFCYKISTDELMYVFNNPNSNTSSSSDAFGGVVRTYSDVTTKVIISAYNEDTGTDPNSNKGVVYIYTLP